ncbi:MAG: transcriptional activator NhaR [Myxococcota bacterium]
MEWLNYHHLLYFWSVVRDGGVGPAAARLRLAPQTISGQVRALEATLGEKLFEKRGRRLVPTEMGRLVLSYADDIFGLGRELLNAVRGHATGRAPRLVVGIAQVVPKLVAKRLLEPALRGRAPSAAKARRAGAEASAVEPGLRVRLVCREDATEALLAGLAAHRLDALLLDAPIGASAGIRAFNHLLGECGVTFFAPKRDARRLRRGFPKSLDGAPMLLPTEEASLRRGLEDWFAAEGVTPDVVGEFDDSALLKVFGQAGHGLFAAPSAIAAEVAEQWGVAAIGHTDAVRERFYVVTMQKKLEHPALAAITEAARRDLFGAAPVGRPRPAS